MNIDQKGNANINQNKGPSLPQKPSPPVKVIRATGVPRGR